MSDGLAEIEAERATARTALAEAETMMKRSSRDPEAFAQAKQAREAAQAYLERLDWAEKAEQERAAEAEAREKAERLAEAQQRAASAHDRARELAAEVGALVESLAAKVRELHECQQAVDRGVHHESFALNDGTLPRQTVNPKLALDGDAAVLALRAARELAKLSSISLDVAQTRASQGRL